MRCLEKKTVVKRCLEKKTVAKCTIKLTKWANGTGHILSRLYCDLKSSNNLTELSYTFIVFFYTEFFIKSINSSLKGYKPPMTLVLEMHLLLVPGSLISENKHEILNQWYNYFLLKYKILLFENSRPSTNTQCILTRSWL